MRKFTVMLVTLGFLGGPFVATALVQSQASEALAQFRPKTEDQKARASIFARPGAQPLQPNTTRIDNGEGGLLPPHPAPDYSVFLREFVCQSELVVVGRATSKQSFLASGDSSIFTDYSIAVDEFMRGSVTLKQPAATSTIVVTLRGGVIPTPSGPIEVKNQEPLDGGDTYLLFLKRVKRLSSFELSGPPFSVAGGSPRPKSKHELPTVLADGDKATRELLADVKAVASRCQNGSLK